MITPLEIRQHNFKKVLRGYDPEEVRAFLQSVSQEWEKSLEEHRKIKSDLEKTKSSLEHFKEMEAILHKTLLQAEQSSKATLENAKKDAELKVQEAEYKANEILSSIQTDRRQLEREINELINRRNDILQQLKTFLANQSDRIRTFETQEALPYSPENDRSRQSFFDAYFAETSDVSNIAVEIAKEL
ncbi:MAG: DivIVA domain-containing protein [Sphingobacteriia bacterium]|jgi:cell division initiation protein|nr:DivIVA domain-containing protein [Sphingobacteriia bacterium]